MYSSYAEYEYTLAATQLVLAMFGMGLTLTTRDFIAIVATPRDGDRGHPAADHRRAADRVGPHAGDAATRRLGGRLDHGGRDAGRLDWNLYPNGEGFAVLVLCAILVLVGDLVPRWLGLTPEDRVAIGVELSVRNMNLAVLLKASLFPATAESDPLADGVLFAALMYGGVALWLGWLPAGHNRRRLKKLEAAAAAAR